MESTLEIKNSTSELTDRDWIIKDTIDSRVVKISLWRDMYDYHKLDTRRGVFVFINIFFQVKYIGKADEGRMVLEIADAIRNGKSNGVSLIKVLYTSSSEKTQSLHSDLISKYNPTNNFI